MSLSLSYTSQNQGGAGGSANLMGQPVIVTYPALNLGAGTFTEYTPLILMTAGAFLLVVLLKHRKSI